MTNQTQVAKQIFTTTCAQIEEIFNAGGWTNNEVMMFRVVTANWFAKVNRRYLLEETGYENVIELYDEAIDQIKLLGSTLAEGVDKDGFAKTQKLREAVIELVTSQVNDDLGTFDLAFRFIVQQQMLQLWRHMKNNINKEIADELVTPVNNALQTAINAELEVANAA